MTGALAQTLAGLPRPTITAHLAQPGDDLVDEVRSLVVRQLPLGRCTADLVAHRLGISRRTLIRRLATAGASFQDLLEAARMELCLSYLQGDSSLTAVAGLLGFSSLSTFSRWFVSRFGQTSSGWRRSHLPMAG